MTNQVSGGSARYGDNYLSELRRVLENYLRPRSGNILEWGTGYSTAEILRHLQSVNCKFFLSIDDQEHYLQSWSKTLPTPNFFHLKCISLTGSCTNDRDRGVNYSTYPLTLGKEFDFVFIDGRRRIECAYAAALAAHDQTTIVLHDYRRIRYQPIKALYETVEEGPQFLVMRVRSDALALIEGPSAHIREKMAQQDAAFPIA